MNKIFKHILSLAAFASLFAGVAFAQTTPKTVDSKSDPIHVTKVANQNADGTYTLRLESFVTGYKSNITTTTVSSLPLDLVLVLDVSGSMSDKMTTVSYTARNSQSYSYNGYGSNSYYYKHSDDKYYKVSRESSEIFIAQSSQGYTPSTINSGEYYYLHTDGTYYRVYRGGNNDKNRTVCFYVPSGRNNTTYYLHGTSVNTTSQTFNNNSIAYTGVLYKKSTCYNLTFTANSVKYYLSTSGVTTTAPTNVTSNTGTIWTGVLYTKQTTTSTQTKLAALKTACNSFIDIIASNSNASDPHKISIITFAGENSSSTKATSSSDFTSLKSTINNLSANGGTFPGEAMTKANNILNGVTRRSSKLVVMFTDGVPAGKTNDPDSYFTDGNKKEANNTINITKGIKSNLKSYDPETKTNVGISVYTVGVFDNIFDDINTYMNAVSSNYPSATSMTDMGTAASDKYYMTASSADELSNIFKDIAESSTDTSNAGAGNTQTTNTNNVTVRDIITPSFVIPSNADGTVDLSKIKVYTAASTGVTKDETFTTDAYAYKVNGYSWGTETLRTDLTVAASKANDGKTTVNVSGFDFSANWVGYFEEYQNDVMTTHEVSPTGNKLIIEITIEPNPDDEGGAVQTNDPASGIYIGDSPTSVTTEIVSYPSTGTQFVPMDMIISKSGLVAGETAIFKVYQGATATGTPLMRVALTADADGTAKVSVAKLSVGTSTNPIVYTVVEETNWTYRYTNNVLQESDSHALFTYDASKDEYTTTNEFKFGVDTTDWNATYYFSENSKNNVFKAVNSAKSTTTTTTPTE